MSRRRLVMAGIVSGSVAVGMLVGAVVFTPGLGFAASETGAGGDVTEICHRILDDGPIASAATAIGVETPELLAALREGATIAEVAEAHGVESSAVVDAIVAAERVRLDRAVEDGVLTREEAERRIAELEEHVTDLVNGNLPMPDVGRMPMLGHPGVWGFADGPIAAAADAIGMGPVELLAELRNGRTIAEVASDHGVEVSAVVDAVVGSLQDRLDAAVDNGWITQAEADELAADLQEQATAIVNGDHGLFPMPGLGSPGHGMFGHGMFGHGPGMDEESGTTEPSTS
jgi:transposase-like protein